MLIQASSFKARDCLNLWHVYLTKQEIESRHVKSRSFVGIDIKELDLIKSPEQQASVSSEPATKESVASLPVLDPPNDSGNAEPSMAHANVNSAQ